MSPKRIQRRRTKGWRMPTGAVYVGRPTVWGNSLTPKNYTIATWDDICAGSMGRPATLAECAEAYRQSLLDEEPWMPTKEEIRQRLVGKDLACWCPLDQPCHADVLLDIANEHL